MYPQQQQSKLDMNLIGQTIRYYDSRLMKIQECSIIDCGSSHMLGDWYTIVYSNNEEDVMIKAVEMGDILKARVD
jgi:hypothetical protein